MLAQPLSGKNQKKTGAIGPGSVLASTLESTMTFFLDQLMNHWRQDHFHGKPHLAAGHHNGVAA